MISFPLLTGSLESIDADLVAVLLPAETDERRRQLDALNTRLGGALDGLIGSDDFQGKPGEVVLTYPGRGTRARRLALVGLGKAVDGAMPLERYRRAGGSLGAKTRGSQVGSLVVVLPEAVKLSDAGFEDDYAAVAGALAEGAALAVYDFDRYKTPDALPESAVPGEMIHRPSKLETISLLLPESADRDRIEATLTVTAAVVEAQVFARDLANSPGNALYPETLADAARASAEETGHTCTVFDEGEIEALGMGGLLAVAAGSDRPPRFLILEHAPAGHESDRPFVIVGKGVTFDAGGISIKPAAGMGEMKMDMSGAAATLGAMRAISRLKLPVRVVGLVPTTENLLGGSAMRPGDILRTMGGITVEVDNTDAEGRLILADALEYAKRYDPALVIDLATLTGACVVALASFASGLMTEDDRVAAVVTEAGERTGERVWRLPLWDDYDGLIKSDVADVKNVGGRWGGAITAGRFLRKFTGEMRWVHLDIAGPAINDGAPLPPYMPKGGTAFGVRLLTDLARRWNAVSADLNATGEKP